ncbi:HTH-type transcriptional regulator BetI [Austwickia sp. TVS 96-490-7B]|uniref:TetR/AcrR family transcriptional regulator n=1 Tax=Austwickia sp. TVS 96-490-7B TaxID=2830843 RepID=UPI001C561CC9|nr:TetR family transcriptional regulator [Austwickia sp. TVS 96-490-7B]MBW3085191.1 HTH-type transcriptional regulator BetI [Austwickia sp. TVS 96-490-7B]
MTIGPRTRRGPRHADAESTRAAILRAARSSFSHHGYAGTSLRAIARDVGVDASLLSYYFGSKENLFNQAMELPPSPRDVVADALTHPPHALGEALTRGLLRAWAEEDHRVAAQGVLQSLSTRDDFAHHVLDYAMQHVVGPLAAALGTPDALVRASLAVTQLTGLAIARHAIPVPSVSSLDEDTLVAAVAPVVQHYLTGDLTCHPIGECSTR